MTYLIFIVDNTTLAWLLWLSNFKLGKEVIRQLSSKLHNIVNIRFQFRNCVMKNVFGLEQNIKINIEIMHKLNAKIMY